MRKADLKITNSKILIGYDLIEAGVAISEGKIARVAKESNLPLSDETVNARGTLIMPGIVDAHVHLRDMNLSYKEDFSSGTLAAIAGGVTTVLDMPNTSPPTTNATRLDEKISKAAGMIYSNVGFFGALSLAPNETGKMAAGGAIGFKLYLNDPKYDSLHNKDLWASVFRPLKQKNMPIAVHAEFLSKEVARKTSNSPTKEIDDFVMAHDPRLESDAVRLCLQIAKELGVHVHVCHLSTESALNVISRGKSSGVPLTVEVTPHHLFLSERDLYNQGSLAKMVPPLRRIEDADSLMQGLLNGKVDMVASDHAPHSEEEKQGKFSETPAGIPGLETMLPLVLTEMLHGKISLKRVIEVLSESPARAFGLGENIGRIAEGYNADLTLVDLRKEKEICAHGFHSKAKYSPFEGRKVKGIPTMTIVNGIPVMRDEEIIGKPGDGKIVQPSRTDLKN